MRESGSSTAQATQPTRNPSEQTGSDRLCRDLKVWWRFVESELAVDQEFFYQLPNRKHATLVRTESGGFRFSSVEAELPGGEGLLIQGTSFVTVDQLVALICSWTTERRSRITLRSVDGEVLEFTGGLAENHGEMEDEILRLVEQENGPLRIAAVVLRVEGGEIPSEPLRARGGMVLASVEGMEDS